MSKNLSKKVKSLLALSLCCAITFQNVMVISNATQADIDINNETTNISIDSEIQDESTNNPELDSEEVADDTQEEIVDEVTEEIIEETTDDAIEEDNTEISEEDPGRPNMGATMARSAAMANLDIVTLSNPKAIGSGKVTASETLNVRSGPSTSYEKIGSLKANSTVEVLGTSGSWYKIDFNGKDGYISASYLALNALDKGIDVSKWNGDIDWQSVKKSGVNYAIIRAGYGSSTVDPKFEANIKGALNAGIKVGVYWFSYATSVEKAKVEAQKCLETLAPYKGKLTYPIFFDFEYDSVDKAAAQGIQITKDLASDMANAFISTVKSNGYLAGLYTNNDFGSRYFRDDLIYSNHIWHAQYSSKNTFNKPYSIWQYSDKGSVPGIKGDVDLNYTTLKTFDIGTDTTPPSSECEAGVTTTKLNLTVGPFSYATVVTSVNSGATVEILDKGISGWYYVRYNGQKGYLPSQYVSINGVVAEVGVATSDINLTVGPFTYATIAASINSGSSVEILDKGFSGWYYVKYNGQKGYVPSQYISINGTIAETGITNSTLNLTVGPFSYATVVTSVSKGEYVEILDKGISGWYYVRYNGKKGYLPVQSVSINSSEAGKTTRSLNLTVGPFSYATVVTSISKNAVVEILDKGFSGWYYVRYNGQKGYIPSQYVSINGYIAEVGVTSSKLNLTVGPFSYATVVTSIDKDSSVEILDDSISGWYYVNYNGKKGYLPTQYVK